MVNPASAVSDRENSPVWYHRLNGYHWLVLTVSTMAWAFDCLSQQIFNLTRKPAMEELTNASPGAAFYGSLSTTALLVGWATGGIIFGIMGDRIGRAKTLTIMILCYSISTGLCGVSVGPWDYIIYCFITGVGAGGIFPIACTLVAESLPDSTRPQALGMVQTFSALGNIGAGFISLGMVALLAHGVIGVHWRWMFSVGIIPSLLAIVVARKLREPDAWKKAKAEGRVKKAGLGELFADPRWARNAVIGLMLAASGVVGLWGIGVFSNDLTQRFIGRQFDDEQRASKQNEQDSQFVALAVASPENFDLAKQANIQPSQLLGADLTDKDSQILLSTAVAVDAKGEKVSPKSVLALVDKADQARIEKMVSATTTGSIQEHIDRIKARVRSRNITVLQWAAVTLIMFNVGAFFGMYAFARVTQRIGRRPTFAIFFVIAMVTTALAFWRMEQMPRDLWMVVLMGGAQLSVFGGYAIYFPELFPTRLRSTGMSFCYNVGRYAAAAGPFTKGLLTSYVFAGMAATDPSNPERAAGVTMCACFLVGLVALLFAPETKGKPLPE